MTISADQSSAVLVQEINLSQVIVSASTSVVAQVIVANQGPVVPTLITNTQSYLNQYGNPNAQVSFDVYCGLDYFSQGSQLWGLRVVDPSAMYAAVLMWTDGMETYLTQITGGVADPTQPDWMALLPTGTGNEAIALFYPALGPGQYGDNTAISITSNNINPPTGLAATSSTTGGMLAASTYSYQVSAISGAGGTLATNIVTVVIAAGTTTNEVTLTWNPVIGATGYNVYGRVAGTIGLLATVGAATTTFTDTGAVMASTTVFPITSPAKLPPANPFFSVNVFNTAQSSTYAVENFNCSLTDMTDPTGMEAELEQRINPFSQWIQVTSNVPALLTVPTVETVPIMNMAGGNNGSLPTSYEVAAGWATFSNKQLYPINILLNSGHSDPTVQRAMDSLAQSRGDSVSLLDVPSASQAFQSAIDYRNLQLNLNSTYSALFSPDMLEADTINGKQQYVPFSGWAAALCARTDRVANPSYSIAGLNRGIVNVLGTRYTYDAGEMNSLFQAQVNYTQTFVGSGTALWEQQTLSTEFSALSWVSVRRIVNVLKTSLYSFLLYSLQEPNDQFLGNQIVGSCSAYLLALQNARAISSFDVVSDSSNNTAQDLNSGIRNVTVIIIPTIPTHIIQLTVAISQQGVSFAETLAQVAPS
jgi:hypothetical protein